WLLEHSLKKEAAILRTVACRHVPTLLRADPAGRFLYRTFHAGAPLEEFDSATERVAAFRALLRAAQALFRAFHESPLGCYVIRDVKPLNLILSPTSRRVTLVDVGSVRPESNMLPRTRTPSRVG